MTTVAIEADRIKMKINKELEEQLEKLKNTPIGRHEDIKNIKEKVLTLRAMKEAVIDR